MQTLPDYLADGLDVISVGLNPSLPSVARGYYFANPRNRFWRALNASDLLHEKLEPGKAAMQQLFENESIGYTDLVKRPTANASTLRATDYRSGAAQLAARLEQHQPRIAWFHGKLAIGHFLRYTSPEHLEQISWGRQSFSLGKMIVYVSPNPSPANAAYSLDDIVASYNQLAGIKRNLS